MKLKIQEAVKASLKGKAAFITIGGSLLAYTLLALFSLPAYSSQLLGRSLTYFPNVIETATVGMIETSGMLGFALTVTYALITGITVTNAYLSFKARNFSRILDVGAFVPGFLIAGCASCGVGFLAAFGFTGLLAALPFDGNLVKLGGIAVMAGLLNRSGNPRICANPNE